MNRALVTGVALAVVLVACGSDDEAATSEPPATETPATDPSVATEPPAGTEPSATEPPPTDPPATTEPAPDEPASFPEAADLATVELLTPAGGDAQPMLAWAPVDGAASYRLVVLTADGSPYWAWLGDETEVRFGGAPDGGGQTAILFEPMTWTVIAVDASGQPVAISDPGELTP